MSQEPTKRELFAAMAMQGFLSVRHPGGASLDQIARASVQQADALMHWLEQTPPLPAPRRCRTQVVDGTPVTVDPGPGMRLLLVGEIKPRQGYDVLFGGGWTVGEDFGETVSPVDPPHRTWAGIPVKLVK